MQSRCNAKGAGVLGAGAATTDSMRRSRVRRAVVDARELFRERRPRLGGAYSIPNSTGALGTGNTVAIDFYSPLNPPNPQWLGDVQAYISIPSEVAEMSTKVTPGGTSARGVH